MFQFQLVSKISNFNWYQKCFTLYLVSKFIIYFNWYQNIKYFTFIGIMFQKSSIGILKFCLFTVLPKFCFKKFQNFALSIIKILFKVCWYVLPICKGSLTSLLYIDSCWMYLVLRSLTSLLYVIHVCRGSFTSPLMHCILCFMWLGFVIPSSCNACMQGS